MPSRIALRDASLICISSIDWNFLWQGHQEIALRFARAGNDVTYVENTGVRTLRPSDLPRVTQRLRNALLRRGSTARKDSAAVRVIAPLVAPFPRSRIARALNDRVLLPRLAARLRRFAGDAPVILTFLPTPNALRLIDLVASPRSVVVYYCIADFQELSDLGTELAESEVALARRADLVFAQSEAFMRRLRPYNSEIHEFQFGVNLELFDPTATSSDPAIARLPRPVIGYSGGLHRHVDFGLLDEIARSFPQGSLVLAGPLQEEPGAALRSRANVHFLGALPIAELPPVVAAFDVALVPYARTAYTDTVFPTKLYEYLAMGRGVVSTDLPEVAKLGLPSFAVRLAHDAADFVQQIRESLSATGPELPAARATIARERDWSTVVSRMAELMAEKRR